MPFRIQTIPFARVFGSVTNNVLGLAIAAGQTAPAAIGGFYGAPSRVPDDYKPSEPSDVQIVLSPQANSIAAGTFVQLDTSITIITAAGARSDVSFAQLVAIPNPWLTTDRLLLTLDNGTGHTFNAQQVDLGDLAGIRFSRNGPALGDTFPGATLHMQSLIWLYKQRCNWCNGVC